MRDHSHKFLFLGLTGLMSAAAFWGSEAGPTFLAGHDPMPPAANAGFTPGDKPDALTATPDASIAVKLAPDGACPAEASEAFPLCRAASKINLSNP
jgi:hypothetical protein